MSRKGSNRRNGESSKCKRELRFEESIEFSAVPVPFFPESEMVGLPKANTSFL
jgi:hypothetical protein